MKRSLHEIERNAQRGGELVKRLVSRLSLASTTIGHGQPGDVLGSRPAPTRSDEVEVFAEIWASGRGPELRTIRSKRARPTAELYRK